MRRYSMPEKEAVAKILPKDRKDGKRLWTMAGYLVFIVVFVVAALFFQHRKQKEIEDKWQSSPATVEDVRPVAVAQGNGQFGGAMLYQMDVLADYKVNGLEQRRWIRIENEPERLPDESQMARWKGKLFVVRWKASQPDQVIAQLN
jgi:hypothetical protein